MDLVEESILIPELGDLLTIVSELYKSTTGRIIFRNGSMIRIRPSHVSDRAVEFPLDPASGLFRESLGVKEIIIHEKAKDYHFSRQLSVLPGELLEFYSIDGKPVADSGVVAVVIANEEQDAIQLEDGRILDFGFIGPSPPIDVIVPRSAPDDVAEPENNATESEATAAEDMIGEETVEELFPDIDMSILPAALVEEIPTSERTYSDSVQREDMFVSLLLDIPFVKQKNPRILRTLYRKTDLLLALKNSVVVRNETGSIQAGAIRSFNPTTVQDLLQLRPNGAPISTILPVAAVKKVLYRDIRDPNNEDDVDGLYEDVEIRYDSPSLMETAESAAAYAKSIDQVGNPFLSYLDTLLRRNMPALVPQQDAVGAPPTTVDQDVLRSRLPSEGIEGFQKGLPAIKAQSRTAEEGSGETLTSAYITKAQVDSSTRLIAGTVLVNSKTGQVFQMAPADTAQTVDSILLTPELAVHRQPMRSSVLLWDIQASEASRARTQTFYRMLMAAWGEQRVLSEDPIELVGLLKERIRPALNLSSAEVLGALDGLGMKTMEMNDPMLEVLVGAINEGRKIWDAAMDGLRKRAVAALQSTEAKPVFPTVGASDSLLWSPAALEQEDVRKALDVLRGREPTLFETAAARSSYMSAKANGTLLPVWYLLSSLQSAEGAAIKAAVSTYHQERRRLERADMNRRMAAAAIAASPAINSCKHVHLLESIKGVREDAKMFALLQDFLNTYKAGQRGNWIICGSCDKNLVCRHEAILLNEFLNPGRSVALHKSLLLEFGGPVFEGAYICKNCGQKISEIEYDSHIEFNDDGIPLVGRTVIAEEAADLKELDLAVPVSEEFSDIKEIAAKYVGDDLRNYFIIRTVLEYCGVAPTREIFDRLVPAIRDFLQAKLTPPDVYKSFVEKAAAAAAGKKTGPVALSYDTYEANTILAAIGALVVLELLTTDVSIPFPARGCKFSRTGFPLEAGAAGAIAAGEPSGDALSYVGCVMAGILRNEAPWTLVSWAAETSIPKRQQVMMGGIRGSINLLLAIPGPKGAPPKPITTITDYYKRGLEQMREKLAGIGAAAEEDIGLASRMDRMPHAFRPVPRVQTGEEATAVVNAKTLETDVGSADFTEVAAYVGQRQGDLVRSVVGQMHRDAAESAKEAGILSETNPRSDGVCCFQRLAVVEMAGSGTRLMEELGESKLAEIEVLERAAKGVAQRDPAASANGTHLFVPWSAPPTTVYQPASDASVYYRLFLKHCFRGTHVGAVHEFGFNYACRHCKFRLPVELEFMVPAEIPTADSRRFEKALAEMTEERKRLALAAFAEQGIEISDTTFHELEDAIHAKRSLRPPVFSGAVSLPTVLEMMQAQLQTSPLLSSAQQDWVALQQAVATQIANNLSESPQRRANFRFFAARQDDMFNAVEGRMIALLGARPTPKSVQDIQNAMAALKEMTETTNTATIADMFVVGGERLAQKYNKIDLRLNRWFNNISKTHKTDLDNIWKSASKVVVESVNTYNSLSDSAKEVIDAVLKRGTAWLGPWLRNWKDSFRPSPRPETLTVSEMVILLRWTVLHFMAALLTEESANYAAVPVDVRATVIRFFHGWLLESIYSRTHARSVEVLYNLDEKQIQEKILARKEAEKNMFIDRLDKLDKDMRKVELIKKSLKIGDWAVSTKNLFKYDADFYEFQRQQRSQMGLPEFMSDVAAEPVENRFGFASFGGLGQNDAAYEHRAVHDEDAF
jgi:hypothetical protein